MGDRSFEEQASAEEKEQIIVAKSLEGGAFGFSRIALSRIKRLTVDPSRAPLQILMNFAVISKAVAQRNGLMQSVGATPDVMERSPMKAVAFVQLWHSGGTRRLKRAFLSSSRKAAT